MGEPFSLDGVMLNFVFEKLISTITHTKNMLLIRKSNVVVRNDSLLDAIKLLGFHYFDTDCRGGVLL